MFNIFHVPRRSVSFRPGFAEMLVPKDDSPAKSSQVEAPKFGKTKKTPGLPRGLQVITPRVRQTGRLAKRR